MSPSPKPSKDASGTGAAKGVGSNGQGSKAKYMAPKAKIKAKKARNLSSGVGAVNIDGTSQRSQAVYVAPVAKVKAKKAVTPSPFAGQDGATAQDRAGQTHGASGVKRTASAEWGDNGCAFAAMTQAVKKHKAAPPPKQVKAPAEMMSPSYEEQDPYRLAHDLRAWATDGAAAVPAPWSTFAEAQLPAALNDAFAGAGFSAPTPIQAQVWPVAAKGSDVIGIAKTGSGKTLGFLVPAYLWMRSAAAKGRVLTLILAPTRELAVQIHADADAFARASGFASACVYGGVPKKEQLPAVRSGAPILVATPGRLNDFLEAKQIDLRSVGYMVLDEADRMLDMGFEPQIRDIVKHVPGQRQTLMFSATWPEDVQSLAHDFLRAPLHIQAGDPTSLQANADISQQVQVVNSSEEKDAALFHALRSTGKQDRVLIFVSRKRQCDLVERALRKKGLAAAAMHSDKDQQEREECLQKFRAGTTQVLVATDVAARGLDVKGVALVINYDTANNTEDHVHRIGRTGRAGHAGRSVTFLTRSGEDAFRAVGIADVMRKAGCPVPREMQEMVDRVLQRQQRAKQDEHKWDSLPKVLMVAEKPSVAKMMAESLTGGRGMRYRKGQSRALQTYEFVSWFQPAHQKCKIIVTSTIGHVFGLDFDQRWGDLADMFHAPVKKTIEAHVAKNRVVEHIQELAGESEYLALWLDCDREGENICFEVMSLCDGIAADNVYRAHFSALTQPEIKNAFEHLARPDKHLAMAVDARQELDLKIGCIFTRLMTRTFLDKAKEKFRVWDQTCLSYGPCQTPTLWFCVERHKEIERFRKQEIFTPKAQITVAGFPVDLAWAEESSMDQKRMKLLERRTGSVKHAIFKKLVSEAKTVKRPVGLNTVQLLKAASTGLGLSPAHCMKVAEGLYSSGFISYPRTETTKYSATFDIRAALREQENHPSWGKTVKYLLRQGRIQSPVSGTDQGDHPPITPMKAAPKDEFSKGKEWRLYDYVTRHFIASLMDDVKYEERRYIFDIGGEEFAFVHHVIQERGFLYAMPWKFKDLHLEELDWEMPKMNAGEKFSVSEVWVDEDYTKPPDYLRESELVSLMDKNGIGTDASIPQHMQNVVDRHYVMICGPAGEDGEKGVVISKGGKKGRKGKGKGKGKGGKGEDGRPPSRHMVPTPLGLSFLASFEELDKELCQPPIRAYMEKQCSQIADGILEKSEVTDQNLKLFHDKFLGFREHIWSLERFFVRRDQGEGGKGGGGGGGGAGWKAYGGKASGGLGGEKGNSWKGKGKKRGPGEWTQSDKKRQKSG